MGSSTLTNRSTGDTILATFYNDIHSAMNVDFVGRNASGVATSGQNLGTTSIPWGTIRGSALVLNGAAVDVGDIVSPQNRLISGKVRTTSGQPAFITPNGAAASLQIVAAVTPLVYDVNGAEFTLSATLTKSSLTVSAVPTCIVNDALATGGQETRLWGEYMSNKSITVDAMAAGITALIGKWATFKVAGAATEYFLAYVESATTLSRCYRGYFYDSTLAPINRTAISDNNVITLMSTAWVFLDDDATTVDVTYNNPVWAYTQPSAPASGDYWYDLANTTWKRYDGAAYQIIGRTFVGIAVIDATNCVAARCVDYWGKFSDDNTVDVAYSSATLALGTNVDQKVNVYGNEIRFNKTIASWNITTDLASAADLYNSTEQASTAYYLYVTKDGQSKISDITPYSRPDLNGYYHPHNTWRCVGLIWNDASSNIVGTGGICLTSQHNVRLQTGNGMGSSSTKIRKYTNSTQTGAAATYVASATLGTVITCFWPGKYTVSMSDANSTGVGEMGVSINSTQLTTDISGITLTDYPMFFQSTVANRINGSAVSFRLKIGDVVRPHFGATLANDTAPGDMFVINRESD